MDEETYSDPKVRTLIGQRYLAVSIDADSDPSLTSRYGDWGWPATIVLAADGTEIVKRRGFIPPAQMASLLQAIIDDPTPGPSVRSAVPVSNARATSLNFQQRIALLKPYEDLYDADHGGWGTIHKFLDARLRSAGDCRRRTRGAVGRCGGVLARPRRAVTGRPQL
jgi:uncharacterized protein